jgi:hypothetical protein
VRGVALRQRCRLDSWPSWSISRDVLDVFSGSARVTACDANTVWVTATAHWLVGLFTGMALGARANTAASAARRRERSAVMRGL